MDVQAGVKGCAHATRSCKRGTGQSETLGTHAMRVQRANLIDAVALEPSPCISRDSLQAGAAGCRTGATAAAI